MAENSAESSHPAVQEAKDQAQQELDAVGQEIKKAQELKKQAQELLNKKDGNTNPENLDTIKPESGDLKRIKDLQDQIEKTTSKKKKGALQKTLGKLQEEQAKSAPGHWESPEGPVSKSAFVEDETITAKINKAEENIAKKVGEEKQAGEAIVETLETLAAQDDLKDYKNIQDYKAEKNELGKVRKSKKQSPTKNESREFGQDIEDEVVEPTPEISPEEAGKLARLIERLGLPADTGPEKIVEMIQTYDLSTPEGKEMAAAFAEIEGEESSESSEKDSEVDEGKRATPLARYKGTVKDWKEQNALIRKAPKVKAAQSQEPGKFGEGIEGVVAPEVKPEEVEKKEFPKMESLSEAYFKLKRENPEKAEKLLKGLAGRKTYEFVTDPQTGKTKRQYVAFKEGSLQENGDAIFIRYDENGDELKEEKRNLSNVTYRAAKKTKEKPASPYYRLSGELPGGVKRETDDARFNLQPEGYYVVDAGTEIEHVKVEELVKFEQKDAEGKVINVGYAKATPARPMPKKKDGEPAASKPPIGKEEVQLTIDAEVIKPAEAPAENPVDVVDNTPKATQYDKVELKKKSEKELLSFDEFIALQDVPAELKSTWTDDYKKELYQAYFDVSLMMKGKEAEAAREKTSGGDVSDQEVERIKRENELRKIKSTMHVAQWERGDNLNNLNTQYENQLRRAHEELGKAYEPTNKTEDIRLERFLKKESGDSEDVIEKTPSPSWKEAPKPKKAHWWEAFILGKKKEDELQDVPKPEAAPKEPVDYFNPPPKKEEEPKDIFGRTEEEQKMEEENNLRKEIEGAKRFEDIIEILGRRAEVLGSEKIYTSAELIKDIRGMMPLLENISDDEFNSSSYLISHFKQLNRITRAAGLRDKLNALYEAKVRETGTKHDKLLKVELSKEGNEMKIEVKEGDEIKKEMENYYADVVKNWRAAKEKGNNNREAKWLAFYETILKNIQEGKFFDEAVNGNNEASSAYKAIETMMNYRKSDLQREKDDTFLNKDFKKYKRFFDYMEGLKSKN